MKNLLLLIAKTIIVIYFLAYSLIHIAVYLSPQTANFLVFQNYLRRPFNDYKNPKTFGLTNVHNFYLETEPDVKIGIWHFLPFPSIYSYEIHSKLDNSEHFGTHFKENDARPIIIYAHGCDSDRAEFHRRCLCQNLTKLGYHVFALDYRGYGDSSGWPSEIGVVRDVITLFNYLKSHQNKSKIFLWGHSLGTGIIAHAAKNLTELNSLPNGIILEAPYKSISQATKDYILSPFFYNHEWLFKKGDEALKIMNLSLNTGENILKINSKILMMHAADDWFIPIHASRELFEISKQRPKNFPPVNYLEFEKEKSFGHFLIYQNQEIYPIVKEFVEE